MHAFHKMFTDIHVPARSLFNMPIVVDCRLVKIFACTQTMYSPEDMLIYFLFQTLHGYDHR